MKYRYIERCSQGYVEFCRNDEVVRMHTDEVVDVPNWLASKLATNSHFEQVTEDGAGLVAKRGGWPKGKPRKAATRPDEPATDQLEPDGDQ